MTPTPQNFFVPAPDQAETCDENCTIRAQSRRHRSVGVPGHHQLTTDKATEASRGGGSCAAPTPDEPEKPGFQSAKFAIGPTQPVESQHHLCAACTPRA